MWIVVLFTDDNTVAAVPKFWFHDDYCAWPNKSFKKYIERRVNPNELEFKYLKSKILHKNIDSLLEARSIAQENSGLSSNENLDMNIKVKRIRKPKSIYKKNESINISSPPVLVSEGSEDSTSLCHNSDDSDKDMTYRPFRKVSTSSSIKDDTSNFNFSSGFKVNSETTSSVNISKTTSTEESSTFELSGSANKKLKIFHNKTPISSNNVASKSSFQAPIVDKTSPLSSHPSNTLMLTHPHIEVENDQAFKKFVTRSLTCIKYEIESIQKRQDSFHTLLETYVEKLSNPSILPAGNWDSDVFYELVCIENINELEMMEERLVTDKSYRNQVIISLNRLVGDSVSETVRKIMQKLFSDNLLAKYSYIGFKGKHQFSTLQCCSLIFESINKMKKFCDAPLKEIKKPIELWLAQAPSRLKKQAARLT